MKLAWLRNLLLLDFAVLFLLGVLFMVTPQHVLLAFRFKDLPAGVGYIIGLWGCGLVTLSGGYLLAALDPYRHVAWIQVGIARGVLECLLGIIYLALGIVTFSQAAFGIIAAALFALAYIILYPRRVVPVPTTASAV
jgi:hypothetical protein